MPGFDPTRFPGVKIHESCYIDEPCSIGPGTKIWHFSHVMQNCTIGRNCNLGQNVVVSPDVTLGDNVKVQNNVSIYTGCVLEDDVFCGPSMVFTNIINPRCEIPRRDQYQTTLVKKGASLGANSTIVCGSTVGRFAFIAAGAVVTRDVPDYALMIGVPARRRGWVCRCGETLAPENANGIAAPAPDHRGPDTMFACAACGNQYRQPPGAESLLPIQEVQT